MTMTNEYFWMYQFVGIFMATGLIGILAMVLVTCFDGINYNHDITEKPTS